LAAETGSVSRKHLNSVSHPDVHDLCRARIPTLHNVWSRVLYAGG